MVSGITITHPDRVISETGHITKGELAEYYSGIAPPSCCLISSRHPLSLLRCPSGIDGECFFQRNPGKGLGADIKPFAFRHKGKKYEYLYIEDEKACWKWFRWARSNCIPGARRSMRSITRTG